MMTKTERLSRPASGSPHGIRRHLGEAAVDAAKRFCMIRVPRWAWLGGLGLAVGIILAAGGSAGAAPHKPSCSSVTNEGTVFKILNNQTYALCAVASCFVFNEVAYCKCDVEFGDSLSLSLEFDDGQDVCTVNEEGVKNGYMVSTFSVPNSVLKPKGDMATYTCPGETPQKAGSDGAYAQCDGGICFKSTQKQSFPGFDERLAKDEIICSCPITLQRQTDPVGYQIAGPFPCQQSFFENCSRAVANENTGSTLYVGAPTGTGDLLAFLLTGSVPNSNKCFQTPPRK
jgi:hypothetical protein